MNTVCTLIENIDGKIKIQYSQVSKEDLSPNFWMRTWKYVSLTQEKIDEILSIKDWDMKKIQDLLKTL